MRARIESPCSLAYSSEVTTSAAAPSFKLDEFPAVTDNSFAASAVLPAVADAAALVRGVRQPFLPARYDDLAVAALDRLRRQHHRLEPRATHLVDADREDAGGNPRVKSRLPRRRLPEAGTHDI